MGASASLEPRTLPVEPGGQAVLVVTIRNTGAVVDEFAIEALGDIGAWAAADPPTLSLFPGAQGTVQLTFSPPREPSTKAGPTPFGVMVRSHEDPNGSTVEEGTLDVGTFLAPSAELVPRTSHGSRAGHHDLALDNRGNAALSATLSGVDPDRLVRFAIEPATLPVEPGVAGFAKVAVKPAKTFWRGPAKTRPFKLTVQPEGRSAPLVLDGSYLQESILPPWFLRAVATLVAVLIALVLLWLLVLQPQIRSTAAQTLADFGFTPKPSSAAAGGGGRGASGAGASPSPAASTIVTLTPPPGGVRAPVDGRLDTTTNALIPSSGTLSITDLVFSNPTGASGDLTLERVSPAGTTKLLVLRLENFRDLDYHFVTPITIHDGETLALVANCSSTGSGGVAAPACLPAVFYSGYVQGG